MPTIPAYPQILTTADWQRRKGVLAKVFKGETGVGELLGKMQKEWQKVDWQIFDPSRSGPRKPPRTWRELDERRLLALNSDNILEGVSKKLRQLADDLKKLVKDQGWERSPAIPRPTRDHVERHMVQAARDLASKVKDIDDSAFDDLQEKLDREGKKLFQDATAHLDLRKRMVGVVEEWHREMQGHDRQMDKYVTLAALKRSEASTHAGKQMTAGVLASSAMVERYAVEAEKLLAEAVEAWRKQTVAGSELMESRRDFAGRDELPEQMRDQYKQESGRYFHQATTTTEKINLLLAGMKAKAARVRTQAEETARLALEVRKPEEYVRMLDEIRTALDKAADTMSERRAKVLGRVALWKTRLAGQGTNAEKLKFLTPGQEGHRRRHGADRRQPGRGERPGQARRRNPPGAPAGRGRPAGVGGSRPAGEANPRGRQGVQGRGAQRRAFLPGQPGEIVADLIRPAGVAARDRQRVRRAPAGWEVELNTARLKKVSGLLKNLSPLGSAAGAAYKTVVAIKSLVT
jgi:hypothetical protein